MQFVCYLVLIAPIYHNSHSVMECYNFFHCFKLVVMVIFLFQRCSFTGIVTIFVTRNALFHTLPLRDVVAVTVTEKELSSIFLLFCIKY